MLRDETELRVDTSKQTMWEGTQRGFPVITAASNYFEVVLAWWQVVFNWQVVRLPSVSNCQVSDYHKCDLNPSKTLMAIVKSTIMDLV